MTGWHGTDPPRRLLSAWALAWLLCHVSVAEAKLGIVRAFANAKEVQEMPSMFDLWTTVPPCETAPTVEVDVMLVYSQSFQENTAALSATQGVIDAFESASVPWVRCFASLRSFDAGLTAAEDVYDSRGYAARNDWANGPNSVFLFVMRSFKDGTFGSYDAFYFMEFDAVPIRPNWLHRFVDEAYHDSGPQGAAVRGSRYRGDTWDPFLSALPLDVLFHVNGNAIYNLTHPWLNSMVSTLQSELQAGTLSSAFDIRMAQLTLAEYDSSDESNPYRGDSELIGNYAQTLLSFSFETPEFIRHAALHNFYEELQNSQVTLGVLANYDVSDFMSSLAKTRHPFRRVVMAGDSSLLDTVPQSQTVATSQGDTQVTAFALADHWVTSYCEIAERVTTQFVTFIDALSVLQGMVYILMDSEGQPVLPYISADSDYCTSFTSCPSELEEAELLFGVKLNYHHDTFETVFDTAQFLRFCTAFRLATSDLGSYEECGIVNGVTADSYIAWLLSMSDSEPFNYAPKNKERYGSRGWRQLVRSHDVDTRSCSVYTEADRLRIAGNITGGPGSCLSIIQDPALCQSTEGCTWRALSQKCVEIPTELDFDFFWTPPTSTTTTTMTATSRTTTATTRTRTATATTRTTTGTATSLTSTSSVSSITSTLVTATSTSVTSTTRSTVTYTLEVSCLPETLPSGLEASSCQDLMSGDSCTVECLPPLHGSSEYICNQEGVFEGNEPICTTRACSFAEEVESFYLTTECQNVSAGGFCFIGCPEEYQGLETLFFCGPDWLLRGILPVCEQVECDLGSLPLGIGADVTDCQATVAGQSCEVSCRQGFSGSSQTMSCLDSGLFQGQAVSCERQPCEATWSDESIRLDCRAGSSGTSAEEALHGDVCVAYCSAAYVGTSTELTCVEGAFQGALPNCLPVICSWQGFALRTNVDNTDCNGVKPGEGCSLSCAAGYVASGDPAVLCGADNFFSEPRFNCDAISCSDLSQEVGFEPNKVGHTCDGAKFSELCSTFCLEGYELESPSAQLLCGASGSFTALDGSAAPPPSCLPLPCTSGFPTMRGASHNCSGITTGETCEVTAMAGYTAVPSRSILECSTDGSLVGSMPEIQLGLCAAGSFPTGVGSTCQDKAMGAECWAYCERNYLGTARRYFCQLSASGSPELVAESLEIACVADRRLVSDASAPRLLQTAPCDAASVQAFGLADPQYVHSCEGIDHDSVCISHCSLGWEMIQGPSVLVCDSGSLAGSPLPVCQAQPCNFSWPGAKVDHDCDGTLTLQTCEGHCQPGYTGSSSIYTCTGTGNFQGTDPTCEALECAAPQLAATYSHDCSGITLGKKCTVDCAEGYQLNGGVSRLTCSIDGTFQGDGMPNCTALPCANTVPMDPAFSRLPCEGLVYGDQCNVTCNPGFQTNTTTLMCNSQGALTGVLPFCTSVPCDRSFLQRAELLDTCEGVTNGHNCSVFCARGYEAADGVGLEELACRFTGAQVELLGDLPTCTAAPCTEGLPLESERAENNCSDIFFQDSCMEHCIEGYEGTTPIFYCGNDGTATRDSQSICRPAQCDSKVLPSLLLHTCENVSFGENCYAYCPPGYVADELAVRLRCLGPSSALPPVDTSQAAAVTLRASSLPQCAAARCSYNLPWGERYVHNCSATVTGQHCLVSCAEGWTGSTEILTCEATGDLSGSYPLCRTTTMTTTRTWTTTEPPPVVLKASGGYLVTWTQQNASEEHPVAVLAVEQSLHWLLNATVMPEGVGSNLSEAATFPWLLSVWVNGSVNGSWEGNGTEAVDILFDIEFPSDNVTLALEQLVSIFEDRNHALLVEAALQKTGLDALSNAAILEFYVKLTDDVSNLSVDLAYAVPLPPAEDDPAPSDELPEEILAMSIAGGVMLCLCCCVVIFCYFRSRRRAQMDEDESSGGIVPGSKVSISGAQVSIREPPVEEEQLSALPIPKRSAKPPDKELQGMKHELEDLGITFDEDDDEGIDWDELGVYIEEDDEGVSGQDRQMLEDAGVFFDEDDTSGHSHSTSWHEAPDEEEKLFESEGSANEESNTVRLQVMDNSQNPPRIMSDGEQHALRAAGINFQTEASAWWSEKSKTTLGV